MKGDFSRLTGLKAKREHYNGVFKQQGRVQLDSDRNELNSIIAHQRKIRTIDTIGSCGAPIHNSGFEILHPGGVFNDLLIGSGRFYAGGLLCQTSPSSYLPINSFGAGDSMVVDDVSLDGIPLEVGQWVQLITKEHPDGIIGQLTEVQTGLLRMDSNISSLTGDLKPYLRRLILFSEQPDFPQPTGYEPVGGQTDLLYLDVWERHITSIEDPLLREVALGGPDTDTRSKIIAQVKFLPDVGDVTCEDEIEAWNDLIKPPNGRLTTRLVEPADPLDPCQLGESGGFLGLENHLYRVEIHSVDNVGLATFKWSRDNASNAYPIKEFFEEGGGAVFKISLQQNGKDDILKIKQQDWIEVSGDETDLNVETAGTLAKVLKVEGTVLTLDTDVSAHKNEAFPKVRRWEVSNQRPDVTTDIVAGTGFQLEDGIEIEFSGSEYKVGDYWVFSARVLTGEIEILTQEPPLGIKHHYCKLAMVTGLADGSVEIEDCRPEFPPLTELPAAGGGCCTVHVGEDADFQDIQLAIDSLNGGPGEVCIHPGVYVIETPIRVQGDDITIKGCGGTPTIVNSVEQGNGKIFEIRDSRDIHIHDLWCFSIGDSRVIEIENSLFVKVNNCLLVAGGSTDNAGVITVQGLTIETNFYENIILGMIGIRYGRAVEQELNFHLNSRTENSIIFALEHGLFQTEESIILGFDMRENLLQGVNLDLLSRSIFPEQLFEVAKGAQMFGTSDMKKAEKERKKGAKYEGLKTKNNVVAVDMNRVLKVSASETRGTLMSERIEGTSGSFATKLLANNAVADFSGALMDANVIDNILNGTDGILTNLVMEMTIDNNLISAQQAGIELNNFEGITIKNNFITCETFAIAGLGQIVYGLTVSNNRIASQQFGIIFAEIEDPTFQLSYNIQIDQNVISASNVGIGLVSETIFLTDFTAVDNSISGCDQFGIVLRVDGGELQTGIENAASFQRVIQRNSIGVQGVGIEVNLPGCKLLDNEINNNPDESTKSASRGIVVKTSECTVSNNTIQAVANAQQVNQAYGGIYIDLGLDEFENFNQQEVHIINNRILAGIGNGIEIASNITGLAIEENQILGLGLNGIAVQQQVGFVNDLRIKGNHIRNCNALFGTEAAFWWKYAGIVLTNTYKTQIIGNVICDNGNSAGTGGGLPGLGAFYAEEIREFTMSNNQFINNGVPGIDGSQAVINIPLREIANSQIPANSDIQITNNIVKAVNSRALTLGSFATEDEILIAVDHKAIISNNQFESFYDDCIVLLYVSQCTFTGNYASNGLSANAVSIGFGIDVLATGNSTTGQINVTGGSNNLVVNNLQLS